MTLTMRCVMQRFLTSPSVRFAIATRLCAERPIDSKEQQMIQFESRLHTAGIAFDAAQEEQRKEKREKKEKKRITLRLDFFSTSNGTS